MNQNANWARLFLIEGAVTALLGAIALLLPPLIGLATVIMLGWLLIASGLIGLIGTFQRSDAPGFWWNLASAVITGAAGLMLFLWPLGGLLSLSIALGLFLTLDGIFAVGLAFEHRHHFTSRWSWLFANGALDIAFAAIILLWLPTAPVWAFGLFVGADMVFSGVTLIVLGIDMAKDAEQEVLTA